MGSEVTDCAASMEAMRTAARGNVYHNPMAISQVLPALHKTSYLTIKTKECLNEDSMCNIISTPFHLSDFWLCLYCQHFVTCLPFRLFGVGACGSCGSFTKWNPSDGDGGSGDAQWSSSCLLSGCAKGQLPAGGTWIAQGEKCWLHVSSSNECLSFSFSLISCSEQSVVLCGRFEKESSLWGSYLSVVNGEQARQSDRRYWHLSSDGTALTEGEDTQTHTHTLWRINSSCPWSGFSFSLVYETKWFAPSGVGDFKIESAQKITIKNTSYWWCKRDHKYFSLIFLWLF